MEYTLNDAYETLKDKRAELEKDLEELIHKISNNEVLTINSSSSGDDVRLRQDQLEQNLLKEIQQMQPENYPIPRTSDLRTEVMKEIEEEIHNMQGLYVSLEERLSDVQENITYLKNKKSALEKMKKTYLDTKKTFANKTYENELILTKHIFQDVKNDLYTVVDTLFPDNEGFKDLLATVSRH
ncbi:uncharacterized protein LOC109855641 isoform X2 [Pseudomyrmex gracilis]|uniref:uncharacterized protein LOC109855641 isoform X2 n=1 Tax=Pseudomyrmex gracilis TaxID=219809 RepID=UPI0009956FDD|nr:uncharacterized protein LOC109855641 isoform X2 [Pseudomyrmex gracilis]